MQQQPNVTAVGGLGLFIDGVMLLGAETTYPALQAIVADGAARRSTVELLALPAERPLVRSFTARVMYTAVQSPSADALTALLLGEMQRSGATRFLLIVAGENELEVAFNELFAASLRQKAR